MAKKKKIKHMPNFHIETTNEAKEGMEGVLFFLATSDNLLS